MIHLGTNLKYLRTQAGLTQEQMAAKIGVKRALVGAYEEGRVEPKLKTIQNICHYFKLSLDALIQTKLEEGAIPVDTQGSGLRILPIVVSQQGEKELSTIVPVKASAGYLQGYGDIDYIEGLPKFGLPFPELSANRSYRLFQISGESMLPMPPGSYIICEYLQDWNEIKNDACYVLVTKNEGVVFKRVLNNLKHGELELRSDNPEYEAYTVKAEEVIEVWKAVGYTSFELPSLPQLGKQPDTLVDAVSQLQKDMAELKKYIQKDAPPG